MVLEDLYDAQTWTVHKGSAYSDAHIVQPATDEKADNGEQDAYRVYVNPLTLHHVQMALMRSPFKIARR